MQLIKFPSSVHHTHANNLFFPTAALCLITMTTQRCYSVSSTLWSFKPQSNSKITSRKPIGVKVHSCSPCTQLHLLHSVRFSYVSKVCTTKTMLLKNELLILKRINTWEDKQIPSSRLLLQERHFDYKLHFYHIGVTCPANIHALICL